MNKSKISRRIGLPLIGLLILSSATVRADQDSVVTADSEDTVAAPVETTEITEDTVEVTEPLVGNIDNGKALFQGGQAFVNGGPSCVVCHSVTHDDVIPGGLFAKDLTDVYSRLGDGLSSWLGAPPFPAMATTYNNNPLTEQERVDLTAFFKHVNDTKSTQTAQSGYSYFFIGGSIGVIILLGLIQLLWSRRKRKMVKEDIFKRQNRAWDAKF